MVSSHVLSTHERPHVSVAFDQTPPDANRTGTLKKQAGEPYAWLEP